MKYGELKYPISDYIKNKLEKIHSYTFVDIGANVGLTSRDVFIKNSNVKQIICVEPVRRTFLCLEKNTSNFKNKLLFNFALGKDNSKEKIYIDNANNGNASLVKSMMSTSKYDSYQAEEIEVKSVDGFTLENKNALLNHPLIIKIDTQLYDELIFSLLPEEIIKNTHMVCYEFTHLENIKVPKFSIDTFTRNLNYFGTIWSEDFGEISKEELLEICSRNNMKYLETDIYLIK